MVQTVNEEVIVDYYASKRLSQSYLKKVGGKVSDITKELDPNLSFLKIGKGVDCKLTGTPQDFDREFYVMQAKSPSDAIKSVIELVYEKVVEDYSNFLEEAEPENELFTVEEMTPLSVFGKDLGSYETYILDACKQVGYGQSYKAETRVTKILDNSEYYVALLESKDKIILSPEEFETVVKVSKSLKENPLTKKYFDLEFFENNPLVDIYYQLPIAFTIYHRGEAIDCKALLDIVVIEYKSDTREEIKSITPIDLKTMSGDTYEFSSSFKLRRYDIQAYWYTLALSHLYPEDLINPFQFVVESTTVPGKPLVFEVDSSVIDFTMNGDRYNKGVNELLDRYLFYLKNGSEVEKEIAEYGGKPIKISIDGIVRKENTNFMS